MDIKKIEEYVAAEFDSQVFPAIKGFVEIPNVSPGFDPDWETNGLADKAVKHIADWIEKQKLKGCTVEILKEPKRTHCILAIIEATNPKPDERTLFFYGHCDKQPPCTGQWRQGLDPYKPTLEGTKLYGRGASDDGYAPFAIISSIKTCQQLGLPHDRCVMVIESCEESGSADLGYYMEVIKDKIKTPSIMFIMDSGCGDYQRIWLTTTLRGIIACNLRVSVLKEGVHSGDAGGIVPETFRIVRELLTRLDDPKTGQVRDTFQVQVPEHRLKEITAAANLLGKQLYDHLPFVEGAVPMADTPADLLLRKTWKPSLSITGAEGLPEIKTAGNVLRPETAVRISMRLPPTLDSEKAKKDLTEILTKDPPYNAIVKIDSYVAGPGLNCPDLSPELSKILNDASLHFYGKEPALFGEGGSIPFLSSLAQVYPKAQFIITGVLGPESNAHGPNEMLETAYTKKMISSLAFMIASYCELK